MVDTDRTKDGILVGGVVVSKNRFLLQDEVEEEGVITVGRRFSLGFSLGLEVAVGDAKRETSININGITLYRCSIESPFVMGILLFVLIEADFSCGVHCLHHGP